MKLQKFNLEAYFKYYPPTTEEKVVKHEAINDAALKFAEVLFDSVEDEELLRQSFYAICQARVFANQGITVDNVFNNL